MVALNIFAKIFAIACVIVSILAGGIGFAAFNENDDYFSAILLGIAAIFLFVVGVHYLVTPV